MVYYKKMGSQSEIDRLARELSQYTGEATMQATIVALREQLAHELARRQSAAIIKQELLRIGREYCGVACARPTSGGRDSRLTSHRHRLCSILMHS
jgi:hypothetical protein